MMKMIVLIKGFRYSLFFNQVLKMNCKSALAKEDQCIICSGFIYARHLKACFACHVIFRESKDQAKREAFNNYEKKVLNCYNKLIQEGVLSNELIAGERFLERLE